MLHSLCASLCLRRSMLLLIIGLYFGFLLPKVNTSFCQETICWKVEPSFSKWLMSPPLSTTQWYGAIGVAMRLNLLKTITRSHQSSTLNCYDVPLESPPGFSVFCRGDIFTMRLQPVAVQGDVAANSGSISLCCSEPLLLGRLHFLTRRRIVSSVADNPK